MRDTELAGSAREALLDARGAERLKHGIVHTPPPLAQALVRAVDACLKERFGLRLGLAAREVGLLDPAVGTGAFLAATLMQAGPRRGAPAAFVGVDVDADAVASAEALLRLPAQEARWPLTLLTADSLERLDVPALGDAPIRVVLGNPPWSVRRRVSGDVTDALLEDFRRDASGTRLPERRLGVLKDAYVRFFRWAAEVVRTAPEGGVLAFYTNASFLDGPGHRGMRAALLRFFDGIDVVDLGGSALLSRAGGRDDNVFGVRPSVAMTVAHHVRRGGQLALGRLRLVRVGGSLDEKLAVLAAGPELSWLRPAGPHAAWQRVAASDGRYAHFTALDALFPFHAEGVQTNRDAALVDADPEALLARMRAFVAAEETALLASLNRPRAHYDPALARQRVAAALADGLRPERIAYRPFDTRYFWPVTPACHRPRPKLRRAMASSSFALVTVRKDRGDAPWTHAGAVDAVADSSYLSSRSSCRTRMFPVCAPDGRPNLDAAEAARFLPEAVEVDVDPLLRYALAVLSAPSYRALAGGALKMELPRLPAPPSARHFERVAAAGSALLRAFLDAGPDMSGARLDVGHVALEPCPTRLLEAQRQAEAAVAGLLDALPE